jgi:hypothetical protein
MWKAMVSTQASNTCWLTSLRLQLPFDRSKPDAVAARDDVAAHGIDRGASGEGESERDDDCRDETFH